MKFCFKICKICLYLVLIIKANYLSAVSLDDYWEGILRAQKNFDIQDDSPRRRSLFRTDTPNQITKEAINHKILWFCQRYLEKTTNYPIPKLKLEVRTSLYELYGDIIGTSAFNQNEFVCYSRLKGNEPQIRITFFFDSFMFLPYRWEYFDATGSLYLSEEDESKNGKKDSITRFSQTSKILCPTETIKDRNEIGGPDEWWYYQNCNLKRIEYDSNENGNRERVCFFENNRMTYCDGVGEKEEREGTLAEQNGNLKLALNLFKKSLYEYKKEMVMATPRTCQLLKKIANIEYSEQDFVSFNKTLEEFFESKVCESDSLDILIYKAYYQLYLLSDYKSAKATYLEAEEKYKRLNGDTNGEIVLNLAFAQYMDNDPLACVTTLEKLNPKRLTAKPRFFLFYYRGTCHSELKLYKESYYDLKNASIIGGEKEYLPTVLYKLARVSLVLNRESEGHMYMTQSLLSDIRLFQPIEADPIFKTYVETPIGKNFRVKYYLNKEKNP